MIEAWHFVNDTLRDGQPVPADGETLVHDGKLRLCKSGLHASEDIFDALRYAPGHTICRVQCGGVVERGDGKLVCSERTILWRVDGFDLLLEFARWSALQVADLWDAPDVVLNYLKTGDESIRKAARATAMYAYRAARDARLAAIYPAVVASREGWDVARCAEGAVRAARDAAWDAQAAAWAFRDARDAAWGARAARDATRGARGAQNTARNKQRDHLLKLIESQREKD